MGQEKIKWTKQQKQAITARGSDVLVTASAGTGKTSVLSGRFVDILADKAAGPDVLSILVLTFTDAAAEQMRTRIAGQLKEVLAETKDKHLRYQLMLLAGADISTIHSFCKKIITEYFYKLGLDPTFRVIESDEQKLLKTETLEKTIDWAWQQSNLRAALEQLLYRRDLRTNEGFLSQIINLSDFLDSVVSRENFYQRAILLTEKAGITELGEKQKKIIAEKLEQIIYRIKCAQELSKGQSYAGDFQSTVARSLQTLKSGEWEKCSELIRNFKKPRVYKPKETQESIASLIQRTVKRAVDDFGELSNLATINPDYLKRVGRTASLQTKVVIELTKKFEQLYSQAKHSINSLDFADLEHYALKLLADENSSQDKLLPSETALILQRKYKYIFVDEYQDINPVQQAILDLLSGKDNIFVVGDVKQSIYAFRGAEPKIFVNELKSASADAKKTSNGLRVDLNANWRSEKGILDFVNKIFGRIMTSSFADVDYDESAKLKPGTKEEKHRCAKPTVEFHILNKTETGASESEENSQEKTNVINSRQYQAVMIARRIKQMVGTETGKAEFQIYDKQQDKSRDVEYRDIVILMRSLAKKANDYVEILQLAGVPVSCDAAAGYFEATEISDCLCLLKVLDNPKRDIELAAVLRSPFFKVSDTELAKIKLHSKTYEQHKDFYDCVLDYCNNGQDKKLIDKLKATLLTIEQWRKIAQCGNLADLIWQIYRQSNFLSFVAALPNGRQRQANLLKLHDRAIQFSSFASNAGKVSLRRFVEFIEKLQQTGLDWTGAEPQAQTANAVRIMSVHKSKGLEFPVVFLAELDSQFNKKDSQADLLTHTYDTLGLRIIDHESNTRLSSLAHQIIAEEKLSTALAEEMRILYVATTRARDRLILSASARNKICRDIITEGIFFADKSIADFQLRRSKGHLEWILYGLCDQKDLHSIFKTGLEDKCADDGLFSLKLYDQVQLQQLSEFILSLRSQKSKKAFVAGKPKQTELFSQIKKSLAWRYKYERICQLPAKRSVTQLSHRDDEYFKIDYSKALQRQPKAVLPAEKAGQIESRLIGIVTHSVIANLDLAEPVTYEAVKKTKQKLLAEGAIAEAVAEHIDTNSIVKFFKSELGQTVLDDETIVFREWPFTFALGAFEGKDPFQQDTKYEMQDTIIVQGIIDMLIETPKGLLIIDFKTDNVTDKKADERAKTYHKQLGLYAEAAEAILKNKVLSKWLYFLTPSCAIEIK